MAINNTFEKENNLGLHSSVPVKKNLVAKKIRHFAIYK
jgi:hypothetical protein